MKVEIIVPVINLWQKYTSPCLDSIFEAMIRAKVHNIDSHILLIDNNSTDETSREASKLESELFHYHKNSDRWGFQRSVNFGMMYAWENKMDFGLVCNNDIVMHPEAIWRLVERFDKGDVAMVTGMPVDGEMKAANLIPSLISTLNAKDKESVEETEHPCFSMIMINKPCWEIVGEFDELFAPAYFEDNDYHYRMQLAGLLAILLPTAMFYHYGSMTQNVGSERGRRIVTSEMFEKNRAAFIEKWGGVPTEEKFQHPYNDEKKSIKSTLQNPSA